MLDLRSLELDRERIAMRRKPVDDRSSGIAQSQEFSDFIERFSGRVVTSMADIPIAPQIFMHPGKIKMRVSARDNQSKHRKLQLAIFALPLLFFPVFQQHRVDVSLKMIHGDQRFLQSKSQRFCKADADQQSARQS